MKKQLLLFVLIFSFRWLLAQVPQTLSYQGLLTDATGVPVANGSYNVTFNFYTEATGGTVVQSRTINGVTTYQGLFTTIIGNSQGGSSNAPLNNLNPALGSTQYFIGLQVNNGTELSPRVALTAVPYAFAANTAYGLDAGATVAGSQIGTGINASNITTGTLPAAQIGAGTITDAKITGPISLANGGTGAANAPAARTSLGLGTLSTLSAITTAEITNGTIATADIADGAITDAKITGSITGSKVGAGISAGNISGALTSATIPAANITGTVGFSSAFSNPSTSPVILPSIVSPPTLTVLTYNASVINSPYMNNGSGIFTAPIDGWYSFTGAVGWTGTYPPGTVFGYFTQYRGGVPMADWFIMASTNTVGTNSSTSGVIRLSGSCIAYLNSGDGMAIRVANTSGSSLTYIIDPSQIYFQGVRIGN